MTRIGIVVEYLIGHATYADALRRAAAARPDLITHHYDLHWPQQGLVERVPPIRDNWTLRSSVRTRAILERAPALDAALIHTQTAAVLGPGFMRRVPTVVSSDATPLQFDQVGAAYGHHAQSDRVERVKAAIVARAYRAARTVLVFSDWVRRSVVDDYGIDPDKVLAIHPGTRLPPLADRSASSPAGDGSGPGRILFVGGEFERKGGLDLLEALQGAPFDWRLDVVTRDEVPERPGVTVHRGLAPEDPQLRRLYAEADLFVLPTRGEAVPHVVAEAMAAGLPVISTNVGGIPDLVDDGRTGLLGAPGDIRALRQRIGALLGDPARCRALGAGARAKAERDLDAEVNVGRILDVVAGVAERG